MLTIEQKEVMEINAIVSLLLSHQFEAARALWRKLKGDNKHAGLRGVGVYFNLRDKKFDEALALLQGEQDMFSVFLRSQILLNNKKPREALTNLVEHFDSSLVACAGYCNLLITSAETQGLTLVEMKRVTEAIRHQVAHVDATVVYNLTRFLEQRDKQDEAIALLRDALRANKDKML